MTALPHIRDVIDKRLPLAAALLRSAESSRPPDDATVELWLTIQHRHGIAILGPPFEGGEPLLNGEYVETETAQKAVALACGRPSLYAETTPGGSWETRLHALLDEAPLVLAGEDFCNDHFVRGSEFPYGLTWRHWGHEIVEWLIARGGTHGAVVLPWTYMDFYMRSRVPIDGYAAWADTVLALLRASSVRIATAVAILGSRAT